MLVRSTPAGAEVIVDGATRGKTPLPVYDLAFGTYRVIVRHADGRAAEQHVSLSPVAPSASLMFDLTTAQVPPAGLAAPAVAPPTGTGGAPRPGPREVSIEVVSRPTGARVLVDGQEVGITPLRVSGLAPGTHLIRLEQAGYRPWTGTVDASVGRVTRVSASLEPGKDP
jgi:hypothetical protein